MPEAAKLRKLRMGTDLILLHPTDVARMLRVLEARGYEAEPSDVERAYIAWSQDNHRVDWLPVGPDATDESLFDALTSELVDPAREDEPGATRVAREPAAKPRRPKARATRAVAPKPAPARREPVPRESLDGPARLTLETIEGFFREYGYPPSPREIAAGVGIAIDPERAYRAVVRGLVQTLQDAGHLTPTGRAVCLTHPVERRAKLHA